MEIIAIANHKGGCGKTTTAINLAYSLAQKHQKVLLVDCDPQGHSTLGLNINSEQLSCSVFEVLEAEKSRKVLNKAVIKLFDNLDLLPAKMNLSFIEQILAGKEEREFRLRQALAPLRKIYDYIILDTAPSLGLLTINALLAARRVIIPIEPSTFALNGLQKLHETINLLENKVIHHLDIKHVLTLFSTESKFSRDFLYNLIPFLGGSLFKSKICLCDSIRNAASLGQPVFLHDRQAKSSIEYQNLAAEVMEWVEGKEPVYISHIPEMQPVQVIPHNNCNNDYIELLHKTDHNYQYKYVVDQNGSIHSVKVENFLIPEKVLN